MTTADVLTALSLRYPVGYHLYVTEDHQYWLRMEAHVRAVFRRIAVQDISRPTRIAAIYGAADETWETMLARWEAEPPVFSGGKRTRKVAVAP